MSTEPTTERRPLWLLALLPPAQYLLCLFVGQRAGLRALAGLAADPVAALLGLGLFAAVFALVLGLTGRAWAAWLPGLLLLTLDLVDHYKLLINGAPLTLGDLALAGQAGEIVGFALPQLRASFWVIAAPLLYLVILALLIRFRRSLALPGRQPRSEPRRDAPAWSPVPPGRKAPRRFPARLVLTVAAVVAMLALVFAPFSSDLLRSAAEPDGRETLLRLYASWRSDRMIDGAADPALLERIGSEAATASAGTDETPEGVAGTDAEPPEPEAPAAEETPAPEPVRPTVIFWMSESFFDLTALPGVSFAEDPLPTFHTLQKTSPHGRFLSNTYAGGTGYVEMEVLTGLCSAFLKEADNLTDLPDARYAALPCVTDVLRNCGYAADLLHAYNDKLYNRRWIYHALGFENTWFEEDFPEGAERKGGYLSDLALTEELLRRHGERAGAAPEFYFVISMENHQPYSPGLYGDANDVSMEAEGLNGEEAETLRTYACAARDADAALARLIEYFNETGEPLLLVFWGDHKPNLRVGDGTVYESLGLADSSVTTDWSTETLAEMLSTDWLIWSNYAELPAVEEPESCTLLGLRALRCLGFELTDWWQWLDRRVAPDYLLYRARLFAARDGTLYDAIPEERAAMMEDYAAVVRDLVYGEGTVFRRWREKAEISD